MTRAAWAAALAPLALMAAAVAPAAPAPDSYTAATTYAKLAAHYPFIRIAASDVPPTVRALKDIVYVERGTLALRLDLYLPAASPANGGHPAIVFVHGGGWRTGVRDNFAPMAIRMAERGYAAATVSYRLSPQARYPAAIHDVKAAVRWVRTHAGAYAIDPGRIAIAGGSAGGQIASLVGTTNDDAHFDPDAASGVVSSAVQAIVNIDGLSDFTSEAARRYEDDPAKQPSAAGAWFGGRHAEQPALWREASPLFHAGPATPPILFIGSGQPRFSVGRDAMVARLRAAHVPAEVVVLPDTPHSFWLFDPWLGPTVDATAAFLERHLLSR
jgi:acetyl esterase/lipase